MADEVTWLTTGEAAARLGGVHPETVRRYCDDDLLRWKRLAKGHRRVDAASVNELAAVEKMPPGAEKRAVMADLKRRNAEVNPPAE